MAAVQCGVGDEERRILNEFRRDWITKCEPKLIEYITPSQLLPYIHFLKEFDENIRNVEDHDSRKDAAAIFLQRLVESEEPDWFNVFIQALKHQSENELILAILERGCSQLSDVQRDGSSVDIFKRLLELMEPTLLDGLEPIGVSVHLCAGGYITQDEQEKTKNITEQKDRSSANWFLLTCVPRHKVDWFKGLLQALTDAGQPHIVKDLVYDSNENDEKLENADLSLVTHKMEQLQIGDDERRNAEGVGSFELTHQGDGDTERPLTGANTDSNNLNLNSAAEKPGTSESWKLNDLQEKTNIVDPAPTVATTSGLAEDSVGESTASDQVQPPGGSEIQEAQDRENVEDGEICEGTLRSYQHELAENALKGINTIICAPTGCGKTYVAAYIIKRHLETTPNAKVVFMAKTVPLVNQQYQQLSRLLGPSNRDKIQKFCGNDDTTRLLPLLIGDYKVIILTPQLLENNFIDNEIDGVEKFSMFVFDECHHAQKEDTYNKIMARYCKAKLLRKNVQLPQIVGLTASLGVGKATRDYDAQDHILHLCANLDAPIISTVERNLDELKEIVPVPEEAISTVQERRNDPFKREIYQVMRKIEEIIEESDVGMYVDVNLTDERSSQKYEAHVIELGNDTVKMVDDDPQLVRLIVTCTKHLRVYSVALEVNSNARVKDAFKYMKDRMLEMYSVREKFDEVDKRLMQLYKDVRPTIQRLARDEVLPNPKLVRLRQVLTKAFQEKGPTSRAIVFVKTRASSIALKDWMRDTDDMKILQPERFTGAGAREEEGGMTQHEQESIIQRFRDGTCQLIIATSVAEEGLDIPECNIVVQYDHVTHEISLVQRRGRNRAKDASLHTIGGEKTSQKTRLNIVREAMMTRAVKEVKKLDQNLVRNMIARYQRVDMTKRDNLEKIKAAKIAKKEAGEFALCCGKCQVFAFSNTDLRAIRENQNVIISDEFDQRCERKKHSKPRQFDGINKTGKIYCKKCGWDWGVQVIYRSMTFCMPNLASFVVTDSEGKRTYHKKWIDAPFLVAELDWRDLGKKLNVENVEAAEN